MHGGGDHDGGGGAVGDPTRRLSLVRVLAGRKIQTCSKLVQTCLNVGRKLHSTSRDTLHSRNGALARPQMAAAAGSWTVPVATMGGKGLWNTIAETELFLVQNACAHALRTLGQLSPPLSAVPAPQSGVGRVRIPRHSHPLAQLPEQVSSVTGLARPCHSSARFITSTLKARPMLA
jgi:hypothetical protein